MHLGLSMAGWMDGWLAGCTLGARQEETPQLPRQGYVTPGAHCSDLNTPPAWLAWLACRCCLPACLACRGPAPLDADEIREAVEQLMLRRAPTALVRLIGKNAYAR